MDADPLRLFAGIGVISSYNLGLAAELNQQQPSHLAGELY